eukprot:COSAG05_NODE_13062_length_443_cov_0.674419_1_plen_35_part_10
MLQIVTNLDERLSEDEIQAVIEVSETVHVVVCSVC